MRPVLQTRDIFRDLSEGPSNHKKQMPRYEVFIVNAFGFNILGQSLDIAFIVVYCMKPVVFEKII